MFKNLMIAAGLLISTSQMSESRTTQVVLAHKTYEFSSFSACYENSVNRLNALRYQAIEDHHTAGNIQVEVGGKGLLVQFQHVQVNSDDGVVTLRIKCYNPGIMDLVLTISPN
jgi:tRNA A37 N6-isopentenylltransferase MiaA